MIMDMEKAGGPAYPVEFEFAGAQYQYTGMTLLDHFAGLAMQQLCALRNRDGAWEMPLPEVADMSYQMASAMLASPARIPGGKANADQLRANLRAALSDVADRCGKAEAISIARDWARTKIEGGNQ